MLRRGPMGMRVTAIVAWGWAATAAVGGCGDDGGSSGTASMTGGVTAAVPAATPTGGTMAPMPPPMPAPAAPFCGDGKCDVWEMETAATCPGDCGPKCMAPCASDADCGPGEMCGNLSDGRKCWPAMCAQCTGRCEFEPLACTFSACPGGMSAKPPSTTCTRPCQTSTDCGVGEACASLSTGPTCWPADCADCGTMTCNFNPATCEKTVCGNAGAGGAGGAAGMAGAGGMPGAGGMGTGGMGTGGAGG